MTGEIFILLGSNKGSRLEYLSTAINNIRASIGEIVKMSSIYETAAWGNEKQSTFLNQVIEIQSNYLPETILIKLLQIEDNLGRKRVERWGPREIDLDILFYGGQVISLPNLTVPHTAIAERRFTLIPLKEIAPLFVHPQTKKTITQLLNDCNDPLEVKKFL